MEQEETNNLKKSFNYLGCPIKFGFVTYIQTH